MQTISISREKLKHSPLPDNEIRSLFNLFILAVSVFFVNRILFEKKKKNILAAAFRGTEHVHE